MCTKRSFSRYCKPKKSLQFNFFSYIWHMEKDEIKSAEVDCGFSHCPITRQSAGSCSGPHCGMNACIVLGKCLFVIHGLLEFRCIVSSPLCGHLVDGSLLSCCSRLPSNRFHPLVFICCRLVSSRLHRRFSCLFVSYLRPCCHHLCGLVGLIGQMSLSRWQKDSHILGHVMCRFQRISKSMDENKTLTKGEKSDRDKIYRCRIFLGLQ